MKRTRGERVETTSTVVDLLLTKPAPKEEIYNLLKCLGEKLYEEEGVNIENDRWLYIRACLASDFSVYPTVVPIVLVFAAMFLHSSLQGVVERQFMAPTYQPRPHVITSPSIEESKRFFLDSFFEFLSVVMREFIASDPILASENFVRVFRALDNAWTLGHTQGPIQGEIMTPAQLPEPVKKSTGKVPAAKKGASRKASGKKSVKKE